jgi:hypothetical protein
MFAVPVRFMLRRGCWRAKKCHTSIAEASAEALRLEEINRQSGRPGRLCVYWCPVHQQYHVGHEREDKRP